jgi:hypothetical protein
MGTLRRAIAVRIARNDYETGAPRSMKMGNIASPWRYDVAAYHTLKPENTRPPAI